MSGDNANDEVRPDERLEWTVRLWQQNPRKLYVIAVAAALAGVFGLFMLRGPGGALLGILCVSISTADFWLPLHFRLDGTGARVRCGISVTAIGWESVKRAIESEEGVKLSPLERASRTSPFRGVFVRFANNRDQVLEAIRRHWEGDVRPLEG